MLARYRRFLRAVAVERLGRAAVALVTSSFITFLLLEVARAAGLVTNAYLGLITYLALPVLFVLGLVLIPLAWLRFSRRTGIGLAELLSRRFDEAELAPRPAGAPITRTVALLTLANVVFLGLASARMLHFMDQPVFCGTACHGVMHPEWATYQASPHARVACVDCHVGEGVGALVSAKLNGSWQIISATFDLYERPIPTPVHQLRPARETCERCHWPSKHYGSELKTLVHFADDEASTPRYTTLNMKIDAGPAGDGGVHWHVAAEHEVRYASLGEEREETLWVEVRQPDGSVRRYENRRLAGEAAGAGSAPRVMDCVDCHNRATHQYQQPGPAVDERLRAGAIPRDLPFIKREAVAAVTASYPDRAAAAAGIPTHLHGFYRRLDPGLAAARLDDIDRAATALLEVWDRNVHPGMNIDWGAYPSLLGHREAKGCFRCHSEDLVAADGGTIEHGCTLCHSILAEDAERPLAHLEAPREKDPERSRHLFLQDEFLGSFPVGGPAPPPTS